MHVQQSVKTVRRKAKHTHLVERVRECERGFSRRPHTLFTSLGATALSRTYRS